MHATRPKGHLLDNGVADTFGSVGKLAAFTVRSEVRRTNATLDLQALVSNVI
jgi:hypothetical protein